MEPFSPGEDDADGAREEYDDEGDVDPGFYRHGGVSLSESEREALGDLKGRRVLVVQAGNGEDSLSLVNLGAEVTLVDDQESLAPARGLAEAAGLTLTFVEDDPVDLSDSLRSGDYDVVYSGFGSLAWLPSLADWAGGVAACLKKGGRFVVYDEHPFARIFGESREGADHLFVANSYFGEVVEWEDDGAAESVADEAGSEDGEGPGPEIPAPTWTLGDIVDALGASDLAVVSLREFPESDRFETNLDTLVDVDYDEVSRVPGAMLMVAIRI